MSHLSRSVRIRLLIVILMGVAIPAIASISVSDISPEQLAHSNVAYVLAVCTIVLSGTVASLFCTLMKTIKNHEEKWEHRDSLEREDRKQFRDTLNGIIAKCGR